MDIRVSIRKAIEETTERRNRIMSLLDRHPESKRQAEKEELDQKLIDLCDKLRQAEEGTLKQFGAPAKVGQETPDHIILKGFKARYIYHYYRYDWDTKDITSLTGFIYEKGNVLKRKATIKTSHDRNRLSLTDGAYHFPKSYYMEHQNIFELEEIANMFLNNKIDNLDQFKEEK